MTDAERLLWKHLRLKQIEGFKFRRQQPINRYIVDFVCQEKMLIVEVDGGHHSEMDIERADAMRTKKLEECGYAVLRFWNNEVMGNIAGVLEVIRESLRGHPPLNPLPSREGKEDK